MTRRLAGLAALLLALPLAGCFDPFRPALSQQSGIVSPPPAPTTPAGVVRLHRWCWENRSVDQYREIFTDDYQFAFAQADSAGQAYLTRPWLREDEMTMAQNMWVGGGSRPPATSISITYDQNLNDEPDTRPGMDPIVHRVINTTVNLIVDVGDGTSFTVQGQANFFVVRGDSAKIPQELQDRKFKPDKNRWWIERWEDLYLGGGASLARAPLGPARLVPSSGAPPASTVATSMGVLKAYYRGPL